MLSMAAFFCAVTLRGSRQCKNFRHHCVPTKCRDMPRWVPILRQITAISGQRVCIRNPVICIDGAAVAGAPDKDGTPPPLTPWQHCEGLSADELFLLNATNPGSFDIC